MILETIANLRALVHPAFHPERSSWLPSIDDSTGLAVTEESALTVPPIWQGMVIISGFVAACPLITYRRVGDDQVRAPQHPNYSLLRYEPNREATAVVHWRAQYLNRLLFGDSFAETVRDGLGRPREIWHLPSWMVKPKRVYKRLGGGLTTDATAATPEDRTRGGTILYQVRERNGAEVWLSPEQVYHAPYASFNGVTGASPILTQRQTVALALAIMHSSAAIFANASRPGAVLERPTGAAELDPDGEKALIAAWEYGNRGIVKRGRVAVLQEGTTYKPIETNLQELQFFEHMRQTIPQAAAILNMPAYFLNHDGTSNTYSNVESEWIRLFRQTLRPLMEVDHQEIRRKLLPMGEEEEFFSEFETKAFLEGDTGMRSTYLQRMWMMDALSNQEIARLEKLPPVPADRIGYYSDRQKTKPAPTAGAPAVGDARAAAVTARLAGMVEAALQRAVNREVREVKEAATAGAGLDGFRARLGRFYGRDLPEFVGKVLAPALGEGAASFGHRYAALHHDELSARLSEGAAPADVITLLETWTKDAAREETPRALRWID